MATCEELGFTEEECNALDAETKTALGITATVAEEVEPLGNISHLDQLVGGIYIDPLTGFVGVLSRNVNRRSGVTSYNLSDMQGNSRPLNFSTGARLIDASTRNSYVINRDRSVGSTGKATDKDIQRLLGGEGFGTTTAGLEPVEIQNIESQIRDREARLELERQKILEDRRQNLLNTARSLIESRISEKNEAMGRGAGLLGKDVFRAAATLGGSVLGPGAETPFDIFKGENARIATQELPQIGPNSTIADLESAIQKLQNPQSAPVVPLAGMAGGGMAGPGGLSFGNSKRAVLLGEGTGTGEEVGIFDPAVGGITEVIPLAGGAQEGLVTEEQRRQQLQEKINKVSLSPFPERFRNLRSSLGISGDFDVYQPLTDPTIRSRLGVLPEAIPLEQSTFGRPAGALGEPLSIGRGLQEAVNLGVLSPEAAKRMANLIGFLPNPRNAASQMGTLNPSEKEAILSLYALAGISADDYKFLVDSATISGKARSAVSLAA